MLFADLPLDMLQGIVDLVISDPHGNKTIPGLIAGRGLRGASKALRQLITATKTPYDGRAVYKKSWPHTFRGGLAFGHWGKMERRFFVVRDERTGKVFACTIHAGHRLDEVHRVDRTWPLWRLAQLLNGHDADFTHRLADVESVAEGGVVYVPKRELSPNTMAVTERNQLQTISRPMQEAPTIINKTDFVAHHVANLPNTHEWIKMPTLVLHVAKDYGHHTFVLHRTSFSDPCEFRTSLSDPCDKVYIHELAIALGWFDEGATVQATGWMTSLYCHGRATAPTKYEGPIRFERLEKMANLALHRVAKLARAPDAVKGKRKCWHDGPAARLGRQPRVSAMRAKTLMATQLEYDAASNSDGRFHAHLKTKEARRLEAKGIIDDQYARAGTRASWVEYDSDGEYNSDGDVAEVSPSEWRARNYAVAKAKAQQDYDDMLVPSDDESL